MKFTRRNNTIISPEKVYFSDIGEMSSALHESIEKLRYRDIYFDFSKCRIAEPEFMISLCALANDYRAAGADFHLALPENEKLNRLFINTNWAHHISPKQHSIITFNGYAKVPATLFSTPHEQYSAVSKIVNVILSNVDGVERGDFAAFEWAVNEITDNVLVHAKSHKGFVQVSNFRREKKKISFIVCDVGIGIPESLRRGHKIAYTDDVALRESIKEGVTRDKAVGQGNGLYGSHKVSVMSGGIFKIRSGHAELIAGSDRISVALTKSKFSGTIISAEIDFSNPGLLASALHFNDGVYAPGTRLETLYEDDNEDIITVKMTESTESFGSRKAGLPVRTIILNLMEMHPNHKVIVDFSNISQLVTSSFADEVLGKLLLKVGIDEFERKIAIRGATNINSLIIGRSIAQRRRDVLSERLRAESGHNP